MPTTRFFGPTRCRVAVEVVVLVAGVAAMFPHRVAQAQVGGVYIDAKGMLHEAATLSNDERLAIIQAEAASPAGNADVAAPSPLRKISLRRLEQSVVAAHDAGGDISSEMRYLAGLSRIEYVIFLPDEQDVVLAGPAEGWTQLTTGDVVGARSGRPVLQLDDFVAALRFAFGGGQDGFVGCSIDPTNAGMQQYGQFMNQFTRGIDRSRIPQIAAGAEQAMGPQNVRIFGVPPESRFALKMLAADYRLKRISMGHDASPVKGLTSYIDLASRKLSSSNAGHQLRWWFVGRYDAIEHTSDELAFHFVGQGVEVAVAPVFFNAGGGANPDEKDSDDSAKANPVARQFAATFTKHFEQVAAKIPVFAEVSNLTSLAVAAELIAEKSRSTVTSRTIAGPGGDVGTQERMWRPTSFLDESLHPIEHFPVPSQVPSIGNVRRGKGRSWLITVSGGVEINPRQLAARDVRRPTTDKTLDQLRGSRLPDDAKRWWWD